jgi:hypothetical protein
LDDLIVSSPVPIADRLIAELSILPLPVAQGALLLTVRINMMTMAPQSPPQAMLTAIKSSKPSPLTSPALEVDQPLESPPFSLLITKPPVPIADRLIAELSILPKLTSTVIELSAIASGTGGFVINGEHVLRWKLTSHSNHPHSRC